MSAEITKEIIDRIFKAPGVKYELTVFDALGKPIHEIFKLIFAKIWDEREAQGNHPDKVVEFRKALDPDITYDRINALFKKAAEEWPGIFRDGEDIELAKRHLQVCLGPIEGVRLLGSNLRVIDDAFEYRMPTEAKKKKGQFVTPRHVVGMCVARESLQKEIRDFHDQPAASERKSKELLEQAKTRVEHLIAEAAA